jgi:hypothetical protein
MGRSVGHGLFFAPMSMSRRRKACRRCPDEMVLVVRHMKVSDRYSRHRRRGQPLGLEAYEKAQAGHRSVDSRTASSTPR